MQHTLDDVVAEVAAVPDGWTATDVSRRAGINRSTLHRISNGAVEPTLTTLRELAIVHGMDMTVQLTPLSDPDATTAARILLGPGGADGTAPGPDRHGDVRPGVLAWIDRLERVAAGVKAPADDAGTQATLQILSAAGRAADLRHRPGAVHLRGRRDALRLASAGEACPGRWAVSGGPALELGRGTSGGTAGDAAGDMTGTGGAGGTVPVPGVLWVTDVPAAAALLADTHRRVADPASADVVVAEAGDLLFGDAVTVDGVCFAAPVQQLLDACGLGPDAEAVALATARSWWS